MGFEETIDKYSRIIDSRLNSLFNQKISSSEGFLKTSYSYLKEFVLGGGKRIRPILTIMAYKAVCNHDEEKIYLPAVGIELFHNSSLIHDDIMDEDSERRGLLSMHKNFEQRYLKDHQEFEYKGEIFNEMSKRFGVSMAILQGNILYALTEKCFANSQFENDQVRHTLDIINETYRLINEGQMLDILLEKKIRMTDVDYLTMIEAKTASLFKTAVEVGATLGQAGENQLETLKHYAMNTGIAFQLQDDLIDISPGRKGHALGSDIRKGKSVLLIKKALRKLDKDQQVALSEVWGNEEADQESIQAAIGILHRTGAVDEIKQLAEEKIIEGKSVLEKADLFKEAQEFFISFSDFMLSRDIHD